MIYHRRVLISDRSHNHLHRVTLRPLSRVLNLVHPVRPCVVLSLDPVVVLRVVAAASTSTSISMISISIRPTMLNRADRTVGYRRLAFVYLTIYSSLSCFIVFRKFIIVSFVFPHSITIDHRPFDHHHPSIDHCSSIHRSSFVHPSSASIIVLSIDHRSIHSSAVVHPTFPLSFILRLAPSFASLHPPRPSLHLLTPFILRLFRLLILLPSLCSLHPSAPSCACLSSLYRCLASLPSTLRCLLS